MTTVELARLTLDDVESVARLESRTYSSPWSERVFRDELAAEGRLYLKAVEDGVVVGYGGLMVVGDEAHITTVVVDAERRGGRVGTRIMFALVKEAVRAEATSLTLEVRASNEAAKSLYRRFGMAPVGLRKRYYIDEDALIMWVHDIDSDEYADRLSSIQRELT